MQEIFRQESNFGPIYVKRRLEKDDTDRSTQIRLRAVSLKIALFSGVFMKTVENGFVEVERQLDDQQSKPPQVILRPIH